MKEAPLHTSRDFTAAMLQVLRYKDPDIRDINLYEFDALELTVAAKSPEEASDYLRSFSDSDIHGERLVDKAVKLDIEDEDLIYEDYTGELRFPPSSVPDGSSLSEGFLMTFAEALSWLTVDRGMESPFIFTGRTDVLHY